nr:MAG TPA: hypothetical protein [Caudoviricetes sp.]
MQKIEVSAILSTEVKLRCCPVGRGGYHVSV